MKSQTAEAAVDDRLTPICSIFDSISKGSVILVEFENLLSLIRFESYHAYKRGSGWTRINRHYSVPSWNRQLPNGHGIKEVVTSCIYGTHRLDFRRDPEFEVYLPQSFDKDMFLEPVYVLEDGTTCIEAKKLPKVFTDINVILGRLEAFIRPAYLHNVALSFIEGRPTRYKVPRWGNHWFRRISLSDLHKRYEMSTRGIKQGHFVYVGCKEEVYLLCVARDLCGMPFMQGTYTTSTKPIFYFSNNYLDFISRHEAEKPKFRGGENDLCNVAVYRTYDIPELGGKPFIFPQMGREQNCKNTIFTGEPQLITGNLDEALAHFQTTDFAEFSDIVEKYAATADFIHPSFVRRFEYFI